MTARELITRLLYMSDLDLTIVVETWDNRSIEGVIDAGGCIILTEKDQGTAEWLKDEW